ncbi:unnamed protein product [Mytilus coruscus]|uniref:SERTA domain-containing protein n=1 Tax=Mytilus coruscus TaxID=42192 RepID=A0A6J8A4D5_MYTCO|nr:unnamed protein product [Mytilus coruscus]
MGLKRKFDEPAETGIFQRQSILDISMFKLQSNPVKRVEPSLLRSVLILNTLKHIEVELQKDGVQSSLPDSASFSLDDNSDISMDILPDLHATHDHIFQNDTNVLNTSKATTSPLPPIETFVELSNVSCTGPNALKPHDDRTRCDKNDFFQSHQFHSASPTKVEDMLADLDFSQTDFDIFSTLASSMKLTPLSAEEVIHSFPVHSNVITESYASLFNASVNNSTCKGEVLPEEIENIMQILVGT